MYDYRKGLKNSMNEINLINIRETYHQYLIENDYAIYTKKIYLYWFKKFKVMEFVEAEKEQADQIIIDFLNTINPVTKKQWDNPVSRGFLRSFITCFELNDCKLPDRIIKKGRTVKKLKDPVLPEDIEKLSDAIYLWNFMKGLAFSIVYEGGLRRGEINTIRYSSFNWKKWNRDFEKQVELKIFGKGKKERIVLIDNITCARLIRKLIDQGYTEDQVLREFKESDEKLFDFGDKVFYNYLTKFSKQVLKRNVNPHLLRHSRASNLLDLGAEVKDIQNYLGHSKLATTEIYLHRSQKKSLQNLQSLQQ